MVILCDNIEKARLWATRIFRKIAKVRFVVSGHQAQLICTHLLGLKELDSRLHRAPSPLRTTRSDLAVGMTTTAAAAH